MAHENRLSISPAVSQRSCLIEYNNLDLCYTVLLVKYGKTIDTLLVSVNDLTCNRRHDVVDGQPRSLRGALAAHMPPRYPRQVCHYKQTQQSP